MSWNKPAPAGSASQEVPQSREQPAAAPSDSELRAIDETTKVITRLKKLYKRYVLPVEKRYLFKTFHSPEMTEAEFNSKPQVMLVGQYSVGKTTFIK